MVGRSRVHKVHKGEDGSVIAGRSYPQRVSHRTRSPASYSSFKDKGDGEFALGSVQSG